MSVVTREPVKIPVQGFLNVDVPRNATSDMVDDWIDPQDKLPILLATTLSDPRSGPIEEKEGFILLPEFTTIRTAAWAHNERNEGIVACRATGVFKNGFSQDMRDNATIAGMRGRNSCDLEIIKEAEPAIEAFLALGISTVVVGHSLGGTAAMCLAEKYPQIRAISLFGGAGGLNPKLTGPGPDRATHYHILGDLVSSHCSPAAAKVVRIQKIGFNDWGYAYPHLSSRILRGDPRRWKFITVQELQQSWDRYGTYGIGPWAAKRKEIVCNNPIPGAINTCRSKGFMGNLTDQFTGGVNNFLKRKYSQMAMIK